MFSWIKNFSLKGFVIDFWVGELNCLTFFPGEPIFLRFFLLFRIIVALSPLFELIDAELRLGRSIII